jgi:hypothetical protein
MTVEVENYAIRRSGARRRMCVDPPSLQALAAYLVEDLAERSIDM